LNFLLYPKGKPLMGVDLESPLQSFPDV